MGLAAATAGVGCGCCGPEVTTPHQPPRLCTMPRGPQQLSRSCQKVMFPNRTSLLPLLPPLHFRSLALALPWRAPHNRNHTARCGRPGETMAQGEFRLIPEGLDREAGRVGLGIEAQRKAVTDYLDGGRWKLAGRIRQVESGQARRPAEAPGSADLLQADRRDARDREAGSAVPRRALPARAAEGLEETGFGSCRRHAGGERADHWDHGGCRAGRAEDDLGPHQGGARGGEGEGYQDRRLP